MVLVDSSVWIQYLKGVGPCLPLNQLIDENNICINDLILSELLPSIIHKQEKELAELLLIINRTEMNINWDHIIQMQSMNLKNGINTIGIPDLLIAQNVLDHDLDLYTIDHHFILMSELFGFRIFHP